MTHLNRVGVLAGITAAALFAAAPSYSAGPGPGGGGSAPHFAGPAPISQAAANSNGRFAADRDKGLVRAGDEKATGTPKKQGKTNVGSTKQRSSKSK
jgi:hypothetical protein